MSIGKGVAMRVRIKSRKQSKRKAKHKRLKRVWKCWLDREMDLRIRLPYT